MYSFFNDKATAFVRMALVAICAVFLAIVAAGCDDEGSLEARLEEAKIAIDDGDYDTALTILAGLDENGEVLDTRATAYAGKVGIDTFEILSGVDNGDVDGNDGSIDLFGRMLGAGPQGLLACAQIIEKRSAMGQAIFYLNQSAGSVDALSDNATVRLGIYGLTDFVLLVGQVLCRHFGDQVSPPGSVGLTEAWIQSIKALPDVDFFAIALTAEERAQMNRDIGYVYGAIPVLGVGNDLAEDFDAFLQEIDPNQNGEIEDAEFANYLSGLGE